MDTVDIGTCNKAYAKKHTCQLSMRQVSMGKVSMMGQGAQWNKCQ